MTDWDPHDSEHNPYWWEREEAQRAEEAGWDDRPTRAEAERDAAEDRRHREEERRWS